MNGILPISAVIATKDRAVSLARTLDSLAAQSVLPVEVIAVDGSVGDDSRTVLENWGRSSRPRSPSGGCVPSDWAQPSSGIRASPP